MKRPLDFLLAICLILLRSSTYADEHTIHWNSTNSMFRNRHPSIEVRLGDVVRFVCPDNEGRKNGEYLTVYEVSEFAMGECALESNSREVIKCGVDTNTEKIIRTHQLPIGDSREPPKNVAQFIRSVNPIPNGKEYQPGQTYYYITTSSGKPGGIGQQMYGLCVSKNMRLSMKVLSSQPTPSPSSPKPVRSRTDARRQEDFVTKSSAELMGGQEDEDSENDNAHLLPRDLEIATNPKFRRPSQFDQAAASAGVLDGQFLKVVQMAKEGKTGTFENDREVQKSAEKDAWDPINRHYVADLMNSAYKNANDRVVYQREPDFLIHEEDISTNSLGYSSSSSSSLSAFVIVFLIAVNLLF
ncbi:unnamed protein product [Caenorhabditis nigoni]